MGPDKTEDEGFGGSKFESDNEGWPHFLRNPKGWGQFFLISSSFVACIHPVFRSPLSLI